MEARFSFLGCDHTKADITKDPGCKGTLSNDKDNFRVLLRMS